MVRLLALLDRDIRLATTDRNALEFERRLVEVFGYSRLEALNEVERVLEMIEVIPAAAYEHARAAADERLRDGGKSDWPLLAAALALDVRIWSDDVDFFGVGVPVWSTPNVRLVELA